MTVIDINTTSTLSSQIVQILIVEDEYVIAANLQENLETLGYAVSGITSSATEAFETAAALRPDLVLMDIQLQGEMDGIQAAEQIWNRLQIPVIYVTGHSDQSTLDRAKVTFPFGYILKPVKGKELYMAIETALNRYEREQLLTTMFRSMGDGVIVTNIQGRILFLNRSAELLTGWQQADARNRDLTEVFNVVYEDTHRSIGNVAVDAIQQDTVIFLNEPMLLTTKGGSTLPITDSIAPIQNQKGLITGAVLIFRDDTQRQLQEEHNQAIKRTQMLQQQNEELQRLDQLKNDFLSTVSHELRSPMSSIKMATKMLEVSLQPLGVLTDTASAISRYFNILREEGKRELSLINDLLDLTRLDAGTEPLQLTEIALQYYIPHLAESFIARTQQQQQHLVLHLPDHLPDCTTNLPYLERIVTELLHNACKYTPAGETITVSAQAMAETWELRVSNTGVEIPATEYERIFDKFYRIPNHDPWKHGGTGLGLALVKKLTERLGGQIDVASGGGQTTFVLTFRSGSAATD